MDEKIIIIIIQIILVFSLITIITFFIRLNNAVKLEKRIARYSVNYSKTRQNISILDKLKPLFIRLINNAMCKTRF